jgi:hypothetical protein
LNAELEAEKTKGLEEAAQTEARLEQDTDCRTYARQKYELLEIYICGSSSSEVSSCTALRVIVIEESQLVKNRNLSRPIP